MYVEHTNFSHKNFLRFSSFSCKVITSYASNVVVEFLLKPISCILLSCKVCEMLIKDVVCCPVYLPKIL